MPLSIEPLFEFILVTNSKRMSKGTRIDDRLFARGSTVRGFDRVPTFMHFRFLDRSPFSKSMELGNLGQPRKGIGTQLPKAVRRPTFGRESDMPPLSILPTMIGFQLLGRVPGHRDTPLIETQSGDALIERFDEGI